MSFAVGYLSLVSQRNLFAKLVGLVSGKGDLQSLIYFVVFIVVSITIAFLTNPSESSFRAHLTEQSFRCHLSPLDENQDHKQSDHTSRDFSIFSGPSSRGSRQHGSGQTTVPFHFVHRVSISLRTPKHVFQSFGIFTIAAMAPISKASQSDHRNSWTISDWWYIGAFGKWWRGGVWEAWYLDVTGRVNDEGILGEIRNIKNLDMLPEFQAPSLSRSFPNLSRKDAPPKFRHRRPASSKLQRPGSLPLRPDVVAPSTEYLPFRLNDKIVNALPQGVRQPNSLALSKTVARPSVDASVRPLENSLAITQILRQISVSEASLEDLHIQLRNVQFSATQSHDALLQELESHRERKRQEDASRSELKSLTKTLDASMHAAERIKRDIERRLRDAQTTRDNAQEQIRLFGEEIIALNDQLDSDKSFLEETPAGHSQEEQELSNALDVKRKEIKATEGLLDATDRKSRELEDTLSSELERLELLKQRSQARRHELMQRQRADSLDPYQTADNHDQGSLDQEHASRAVYDSHRSGSLKNSPFEEVESAYEYGYTGGPYGSDAGHISNDICQISGDSTSRRHAQSTLQDCLPYDGPAALPSAWSLSSADELGYLNAHYKNDSHSNSQVKKGLSPDAKAIILERQITPPYDALNPSGLGISTTKSATSTTSSLARAFAPSRAEREALQRALGGSTNSSLECLPSSSNEGSIPTSLSHVHASPTISLPRVDSTADSTKWLHLPSWLPAFLPGKSKFEPWDDDEPVTSEIK
ncbi:hypothetical protein BKA70DRAFT_1093057 [Coprinopsis sp. MPI-PUGE-AT-0042]|nr:hypothetical protein BKA70DRAFT_1093057 [Coprinopsis sp. MPI-PUGE-AT-0042]